MKKFLSVFLSVCALVCAAGELDAAGAWRKGTIKEGVLQVQKKEFSSYKLTVDPKLDYCFSFEYRVLPGGKAGTLRAGFRLYDAKKREIRPFHVILKTTAPAEVAENVKKGDKSVKLRAAASWKKNSHYALAFYAKPDLSDLPNFNTFEGYIAGFQKQGSELTITFKKPLNADIPAGTLVRSHRYGGEFYPAAVKTSDKWQKAEFSLSGIAAKGHDNEITQWNPGTAAASLFFAGSAEIRNITVKTFAKGKAPVSEKKKH